MFEKKLCWLLEGGKVECVFGVLSGGWASTSELGLNPCKW